MRGGEEEVNDDTIFTPKELVSHGLFTTEGNAVRRTEGLL